MFLLSLLLKKLPPDAQNQLFEAGPECSLLLKVECLGKKTKNKILKIWYIRYPLSNWELLQRKRKSLNNSVQFLKLFQGFYFEKKRETVVNRKISCMKLSNLIYKIWDTCCLLSVTVNWDFKCGEEGWGGAVISRLPRRNIHYLPVTAFYMLNSWNKPKLVDVFKSLVKDQWIDGKMEWTTKDKIR